MNSINNGPPALLCQTHLRNTLNAKPIGDTVAASAQLTLKLQWFALSCNRDVPAQELESRYKHTRIPLRNDWNNCSRIAFEVFSGQLTIGVLAHMNTKIILAALALSLTLAGCAKKEEPAEAAQDAAAAAGAAASDASSAASDAAGAATDAASAATDAAAATPPAPAPAEAPKP